MLQKLYKKLTPVQKIYKLKNGVCLVSFWNEASTTYLIFFTPVTLGCTQVFLFLIKICEKKSKMFG